MKGSAEAVLDLNELLTVFENMGPDTKRFSLIERTVHGALPAYRSIHDGEEKQTKQTTVDIFLKRVTPPQEEALEGRAFRRCSRRRHCYLRI